MNSIKLQDIKLIHRNLLHFYTLKTKDHKEKLRITIKSKRIKYLGINLPKEAKHLYCENYQTEQTDGKVYMPCSWIGRINVVKMTALPKATY